MSLRNRRKDFSQKPPKTPIIPGVLSVIDTPSINLTFNNSTQELQADLQSIISPGTYGSTTMIPVFTINSFGQITSITEVPASGGGGGGTVTSVSATVPNPANPALSVNVANPTTTPSVDITANGNVNQVIDGTGALRTIDSISVVSKIYQQDTFLSNALTTSVEYVSALNKIFVTNQTSGNVTIYDASSGVLLNTVPVTNAVKARYIPLNNEVWVTSSTATTIARIDASTNTFIANILGGTANGTDILYYSSTKVFVCCSNASGTIYVVNPTTNLVTATITTSVPTFPSGMALNTNPVSLQFDKIVVCAGGGIAIFDPTTNTITTTVANPSLAFSTGRMIYYSPNDDKYYAASQVNNRLVVLSIATATTFTATIIPNQLFIVDLNIDTVNDLLFTYPMEGGATESVLVKVYQKSTLTPIIAFKTSCFAGAASQAGYNAIDVLNKRIFVVGRNSAANAAISVIRYL